MADTITSESNPLLKDIRRAAARGSLTSDGFALAEGFHLLDEALASGCEVATILAAEAVLPTVATHVRGLTRTRVVSLAARLFDSLATTEASQGVLALVKPPEWTLANLTRGKALVVVLDGIQDPGNAGAILRAAEAFGATGVAFLKGSVNPYNPKCLRASAGSIFRLPVVVGVEEELLIAALSQKRMTMYAAMPKSDLSASQADMARACALVIGAEGRGVAPSLARAMTPVSIPTQGVESLNASVAAAVLLYEARRQRVEAPKAEKP